MTTQEILAIKMKGNSAEAATIGEYLEALLQEVWDRGEGFSGKRPFGTSGWKFEIYEALVQSGQVEGILDEDEELISVDYNAAEELITNCIRDVFAPKEATQANS